MKKVAITTVLDDKYLPGFLITMHSMLKSSKSLNCDLIILEWGDLCDANKSLIKTLYPNTIFKMVDVTSYSNHEYDDTWRKWTYNCNYRFDIFSFADYDRVVFFDCDMIFQIDMAELFALEYDFAAAPASKNQIQQINREIGFEGGLLSIGKKYLNSQTKADLIKVALSTPPPARVKTTKWVSDEPILNTYFLDKITWLPEKFNLTVDRITRDHFKTPQNYQFIGHNKPWYSSNLLEQFDYYVHETITKRNGKYLPSVLLKRLLHLYQVQVKDLQTKGIDIFKYTGGISPVVDPRHNNK